MAKVSPVSIKYMVRASFKSEGPLEKPDVIGALFGQTEGLLGANLELRELQKEGKIGRIEVELETIDGKTVGEIEVPSALDKSETTIVAAALETIDRIGPTEAEIKIMKIEDVRGSKRDYIIARAKKLLEGMEEGGNIEEMSKEIKEGARVAKIQEYGAEKLPAGDLLGNEVIVVEGRADVVNLLKNRINNVIGMNGTKLPDEIAILGKNKEITLFVDGDRGGKLIAKNVITNANIKYVAVAPDGKEVEELMGKEILIALRRKVSVDEYLKREGITITKNEEVEDLKEFEGDVKEEIKKMYNGIKGSKKAMLIDSGMDVIRTVSSKDLFRALSNSRSKVYAIIIDGSATAKIIRMSDEEGIKYLGATTFTAVEGAKVKLISL